MRFQAKWGPVRRPESATKQIVRADALSHSGRIRLWCIDPNGGYSRNLVKLMHKQRDSALTYEPSECADALERIAITQNRFSFPEIEIPEKAGIYFVIKINILLDPRFRGDFVRVLFGRFGLAENRSGYQGERIQAGVSSAQWSPAAKQRSSAKLTFKGCEFACRRHAGKMRFQRSSASRRLINVEIIASFTMI